MILDNEIIANKVLYSVTFAADGKLSLHHKIIDRPIQETRDLPQTNIPPLPPQLSRSSKIGYIANNHFANKQFGMDIVFIFFSKNMEMNLFTLQLLTKYNRTINC